jgi:uncharacterized SAM-binding protein YcdF (DUF218 family)
MVRICAFARLAVHPFGSSKRRRLFSLAAVVLFFLITYEFRDSLLSSIGRFLIVSDPIEAADIIFLLNGDLFDRPQYAAALFHRGLAPNVVIARAEESAPVRAGVYPNITDSSIETLKHLRVPEAKIIQLRPPGGVKHTVDEAKALLAFCQRNQIHRVIVVTTALYSRRASFIFRKVLKPASVRVVVAPIAGSAYRANSWWTTKDGLIGCGVEYIKLLYYCLMY